MDNHAHPHLSTPSTTPRPTRSSQLHEDDACIPGPPSRQQRLLRARNARFPAKKISISGISARFSELIKTNDGKNKNLSPTSAQRNQENSVYKKHKPYGSASLSTASSLGILEEISNSIGSKARPSQRRPPIPIFQDTPERALLDLSPWASPSPFHETSSPAGSPPAFDHIQDSLPAMGLREISGNVRKSSTPEFSSHGVSMPGTRRRRSTQKSRFNSEDYIEHIEKELEIVKDAVYSPNTSRHWKEKLRIAKAENERLRTEILDMEAAFEAEVQKTVEHMTATEVELKKKIRSLEEELEHKDFAMQELEAQHAEKRLDLGTFENLKNAIERLELEKQSLEQDNDSMSKRNEVLTQLLAISPTKTYTNTPFQLSSPVRPRNGVRPRSLMIPRIPSSPVVRANSRPQSVVASPALSATCYFSPRQTTETNPPAYDDTTVRQMRGDASVDSGLGESCSVPAHSQNGSRRSTLASQASMSPTAWGLPLTSSGHPDQPKQQPKRRARRFLPGSTQLKPLLLPALTGEHGALYTTSPVSSPQHKQIRDFSEESIDPTIMFLSQSLTHHQTPSSPSGTGSAISLDQELREHHCQSFQSAFEPPSDPLDMPASLIDRSDIPEWSQQSISDQLEKLDQLDLESLKSPNSDYIKAWMSSPRADPVDEDAEKTILPSYPAESVRFEFPIHSATYRPKGESEGRLLDLHPSPEEGISVDIPPPLFSPSIRRAIQTIDRRRRGPQLTQALIRHEPALESHPGTTQGSRKRRKISSSSLLLDSDEMFRLQTVTQVSNFRPQPHQLPESKRHMAEVEIENVKTHSRSSSRSSSISIRSPHRIKNPFEILQQWSITRSLAVVTIKTIYGTLSRYTTYIREIKRDPLALGRRFIANAWHTNWALLGKLSWWVLGIFLGPSPTNSESFNWEDYDVQSIAERQVESQRLLCDTPAAERHVHFEDQHNSYRTRGSKSPVRPALKKAKPGWTQSLLLWGKFSVAIMMAVGGAVVKGPAEMLKDADARVTGSPRKRAPRVRLPCQDDHEVFDSSSSPMLCITTEDYGLDMDQIDDGVTNLDGGSTNFRRRSYSSSSPSTRTLLRDHDSIDIEQLSSPIATDSPSPVPYQFGTGSNEIFSFDPPVSDTDWGAFEGGDTLKPSTPGRASLDSLFDSPPSGDQESDHESVPFAADLSLFSPSSQKSSDGGRRFTGRLLEGDVLEVENGW